MELLKVIDMEILQAQRHSRGSGTGISKTGYNPNSNMSLNVGKKRPWVRLIKIPKIKGIDRDGEIMRTGLFYHANASRAKRIRCAMIGNHLILGKLDIPRFVLFSGKMWQNALSFRVLVLLLFSMLLTNGCATLYLQEYKTKKIEEYRYLQAKDGLTVAIYPLTNKEENETFFGIDIANTNILPILVIAENRNASSSFILSKDRCSIKVGAVPTVRVAGREQAVSDGEGQAILLTSVGAIGGLLPFSGAVLGASKIISDASIIQHSFTVNELQTHTLSPGKVAHGFVYFKLPEENNVSGQWNFHLEAIDLRDKTIRQFDFIFPWRRE